MTPSAQKTTIIDDCWKRTGVWGDKTCPELKSAQHCKNCKLYSRVGRILLDQKPPAGYIQSWTKQLAEEQKTLPAGQVSLFIFRIGPEWFALPTNILVEVLETREVHSIPHRSNPILQGLINVRGEMQLCVSLGQLLGVDKEFTEPEGGNHKVIERILLISMAGENFAFHISEASGLHTYHSDDLRSLPATLPIEASSNSKGLLIWHDHHVAVLDEKSVFEKLMRGIK